MKNKILLILSYIFTFIEAITLFLIVVLLIFSVTIFNSNYIIRNINKTDYYDNLYKDIKKEMSYYTNQSGFNDNILDNTFSKNTIKRDINLLINNLYEGKETNINDNKIKDNINNNINEFLHKYNYSITNRKDVDEFTNKMISIYKSKIKIVDDIDKIAPKMNKILYLKNIVLIGLFILLVVSVFINTIICHRNNLDIVMYINSLLLLVVRLYIVNKIDINNLYLYNKNISVVLKNVINNILNCYVVVIIIFFIVGLILSIFDVKKSRKKSY